jgi:HAD superfamily hydrolase (TIGR01509 family)
MAGIVAKRHKSTHTHTKTDEDDRKMNASLPLEKIEAWLFDLDGTLMDTDDQTVSRLAHRLRFIGQQRARRLARRAVMFSETPLNGIATVFDVIGLDPLLFFLHQTLSGREIPLFPIIENADRLLHHLHKQKVLGVVTTRSHEEASAFLDQHDLHDYFDLVVTRESTKHLKPNPEPILYAASQLGLSPEQCAMVGDTPVDILSARRAGAWSIGVLCGFGERYELERSGAHLILASTSDLLPHLKDQKASDRPHRGDTA